MHSLSPSTVLCTLFNPIYSLPYLIVIDLCLRLCCLCLLFIHILCTSSNPLIPHFPTPFLLPSSCYLSPFSLPSPSVFAFLFFPSILSFFPPSLLSLYYLSLSSLSSLSLSLSPPLSLSSLSSLLSLLSPLSPLS